MAAREPVASDDTVRVRPGMRRARRRRGAVGGFLVLALAGLGFGWWLAPPARPPPAPVIATATEPEILANAAGDPAVLRFAANHAVLVLDFASLHQQGATLNRLAALVEKAGLPRDRVLDDAALAQAIAASGGTADTWYYGHDYRAADLARFFRLAAAQHVALRPQEDWLHGLLDQQGWLKPDAVGALISLARSGAGPGLDETGRAAILRHELSHGEYFTTPAYATWTRRFWQTVLTPSDRSAFRHFLADEGYDSAQEDLMMNEAQAYLMHTPDHRFFNAAALGVSPAKVAEMRGAFLQGMPPGWLRDATPAPRAAAGAEVITAQRRRRKRRDQCFGSVSSSRAAADRRTPRLRAASSAA